MIQLNSTIRNDIKAGVQNFEYLININNEVYVATRKQMLRQKPDSNLPLVVASDESENLYFEDAGMKISTINESIDLKNKKPILSSTTITLQNFKIYKDERNTHFSDLFDDALGKNVKIFFKTQSCKSFNQCLLLTELKITRINHNDKTITIIANDLSIDSVLKDTHRPQDVLIKNVNTFERYSNKPIPKLYGHLENAPAIPYIEDYENDLKVKLLPDTSFLDGTTIGGISKFDSNKENILIFNDSDGEFGGDVKNTKLQIERQNLLKIGLGDFICDVPCFPYHQTRDAITNVSGTVPNNILFNKAQWHEYGDHILLNLNLESNNDDILKATSLWCSINQKPITQDTKSYHIVNTGGNYIGTWFYGTQENSLTLPSSDLLNTMYLESEYVSDGNAPNNSYTFGVQGFRFIPFSGYELNDIVDENGNNLAKSDVHYIGTNFFTQYTHLNGSDGLDRSPFCFSIFSAPKHDDNAQGIQDFSNFFNNWNDSDFASKIGYPDVIWNELQNGYNFVDYIEEWDEKFKRTALQYQSVLENGENDYTNYRTHLQSTFYEYNQYNSYISRYWDEFLYPIMEANILSLYYFAQNNYSEPQHTIDIPDVRKTVVSKWKDLQMRKVWSNKSVFDKDFFVNAKGKTGDIEENEKTLRNAHMVVKRYDEYSIDGYIDEDLVNQVSYNHFQGLYKYLTDNELRTILVDGELYEIMLVSKKYQTNEYTYLYDLEIQDFKFMPDNLIDFALGSSHIYAPSNAPSEAIAHDTGWLLRFNGKIFGTERQRLTNDKYVLDGVRLVYCKKVYNSEGLQEIIRLDDGNDIDVNLDNGYSFGAGSEPFAPRGLTFVSWETSTPSRKLLQFPHEIIQDLLKDEGGAKINLDNEKINNLLQLTPNYKLAFSINKKKNTRDVVQKICQQSPFYYRYRGRDKKILIDAIRGTYDNSDLSGVIDVDKLYNFSFSKTKIEDTCMGGVQINYKYNYLTDDFDKKTPKRDTGNSRQDYMNFYGVSDLSHYEKIIDAPYVQDEATAQYFRDYYFESNKNQKLKLKFDLPISQSLQYEVGDIIAFNGNPNNIKPYGKDITTQHILIDQKILPYFFITKTNKSLFKCSIECVQLHGFDFTLPNPTLQGDINLDGNITYDTFAWDDLSLLIQMWGGDPDGGKTYDELLNDGWQIQAIVNADFNYDGIVDYEDVLKFIETYGEGD